MGELQQNRYDKLIRRVGGIIGPGSMVSEAVSELFPMIDVERVPGELLALMGTRTAFGAGTVQAGAGVSPQVQLFNPVGSTQMIVVSGFVAGSATGQTILWNINTTPFATLVTRGSLRDTRLRSVAANQSIGEIRTQSVAAPVPGSGIARILANTVLHIGDENAVCVLSPGFGLDIGGNLNASLLNVTFYWRERTLEQSEINI